MGLQEQAAVPVQVGEYEVPILKRRQLAALLTRWSDEDRAALLKLLKDAEASEDTRVEKLTELHNRTRLLTYPYRCVSELGRAQEAILMAIKAVEPGTAEDYVDSLGLRELAARDLAAKLMGLDVSAFYEEATDVPLDKNPNP